MWSSRGKNRTQDCVRNDNVYYELIGNRNLEADIFDTEADIVCSTFLMASLIRSVGGLSKYFYQGL